MAFYVTRSEHESSIIAFIQDNTNRLISEQDVRERFLETKDSYLSQISGFDIPEYSLVTTYQVGDAVTYQNFLYRKINIASSGDLPTDGSQWEMLPDTPFATETKWGIVRKATIVEFEAGIDDEKYVTPFQIASLAIPEVLDDLLDVDLSVLPTEGQGIFWDDFSSQFIAGDSIIVPPSDYLSFVPSTRILTFDDSSIPNSLNDLLDVNISSPLDGDALVYDSITGEWKNGNIGVGGFTPGSVIFAGATGELAEDNASLFFDDANNRFGINTDSPQHPFDARGASNGIFQFEDDGSLQIKRLASTANQVIINSGGNKPQHAGNVFAVNATLLASILDENQTIINGSANSFSTVAIQTFTTGNNTVAIGSGTGAGGTSATVVGFNQTHTTNGIGGTMVGFGNTNKNIPSGNAQIFGMSNSFASDNSAGLCIGFSNSGTQNTVNSAYNKAIFGLYVADDYMADTKGAFIISIGSNSILGNPTVQYKGDQVNHEYFGLISSAVGIDTSSTNTKYQASGTAPTSTPANSSALYMQDYNYANSPVAGTVAPYFRTEEGRTLSVRRAHHRDIYLEFYPVLEDVRYVSWYWDGSTLIKEFIFNTDQIASLSVRFRHSSLGSSGAFSIAYPISYPLNQTEINNLNAGIASSMDTGSVELQVEAIFDVAWETQAFAVMVSEPMEVR